MTVLVYILGALLVIAGAAFISMGLPYVQLEFGWSEVIGGSVAGSVGFVVIAIGAVLSRLESLQRAIVGLGMGSVLRGALADPVGEWQAPADAPAPAPAPTPVFEPVLETPADPLPEPMPIVEPEPSLDEATLHPVHDVPAEPERPRHPIFALDTRHEEPEPLLDEGAPALAAASEVAPPVEPVVPPVILDELIDPLPVAFPPPPSPPPELTRARPNFLATFLARRNGVGAASPPFPSREEGPSIEPTLVPLHDAPGRPTPVRTPIDLSSGWGEAPQPSEDPAEALHAASLPMPHAERSHIETPESQPPEHESPFEPEPISQDEHVDNFHAEAEPQPEPDQPVVVGRYNAGSAAYIMYSNGMIEVETDSGTHQFASMQELKAFIERRDAAPV